MLSQQVLYQNGRERQAQKTFRLLVPRLSRALAFAADPAVGRGRNSGKRSFLFRSEGRSAGFDSKTKTLSRVSRAQN